MNDSLHPQNNDTGELLPQGFQQSQQGHEPEQVSSEVPSDTTVFADYLVSNSNVLANAESSYDLNNTLDAEATGEEAGRFEKIKNWLHKRKTRLILGAAAVSTAVTLMYNPINELKDEVVEAAPWVGGGIVASEAAFCVGAAMMVASIGDKIGNPFKLKSRLPEISQRANDSKLFKSGFWINAVGAVGDFVVLSAGVMKSMPIETYPILGLTLMDLGATIALRKTILDGIKNNMEDADASDITQHQIKEGEV